MQGKRGKKRETKKKSLQKKTLKKKKNEVEKRKFGPGKGSCGPKGGLPGNQGRRKGHVRVEK